MLFDRDTVEINRPAFTLCSFYFEGGVRPLDAADEDKEMKAADQDENSLMSNTDAKLDSNSNAAGMFLVLILSYFCDNEIERAPITTWLCGN
jgi:hypothetical protein